MGPTEWTFAKEIVLLDVELAREPLKEIEVQAVQVGPAVFPTNPAELFCQSGLDIKAKGPFPFTFPVELANGCAGYVPTAEALGEHGGGYETRITSFANLEVGAAQKMVDAALELAGQMTPAKTPMPAPGPALQRRRLVLRQRAAGAGVIAISGDETVRISPAIEDRTGDRGHSRQNIPNC